VIHFEIPFDSLVLTQMRLIGNGLNRVGIEEKFIVEITVLYRNIEFTKAGHSNAALIGFGEIPF